MVHCLHVLDSLALEPLADLEGRDNSGAGALRDVGHISDVITVTMRDEDEIGRDFPGVDLLRERVGSDEGIEE